MGARDTPLMVGPLKNQCNPWPLFAASEHMPNQLSVTWALPRRARARSARVRSSAGAAARHSSSGWS